MAMMNGLITSQVNTISQKIALEMCLSNLRIVVRKAFKINTKA